MSASIIKLLIVRPARILGLLCTIAILLHTSVGAADPISSSELHNLNIGNEYYVQPGDTDCSLAGDESLVGNDAVAKIMDYFVNKKGLSAPQAAGIVGNIQSETAGTFNPSIVQGGAHSNSPVVGKGYGLAQWTDSGRQKNLVAFANKESLPVNSMKAQLDFIWEELSTSYKTSSLEPLQTVTTPQEAAVIIMVNYEAPKDHDPHGPNAKARSQHAADALVAYGAGTDGNTPSDDTGLALGVGCLSGADTAAVAGEGFIGNCAGKGSTAPIHCGQCVAYVEWALGAHADPSKGPYTSLTDQSGPLTYAAATVTKNLAAKGFTVNRTPAVHATFSMSGASGALGNHWGHTGIVSKVNVDNSGNLVSIVVEQSNWSPSGNQELYNGDTVLTADQLKKYDTTYAHTEVGWHD